LRSRCRHTKQKDTGTALIGYSSTKLIAPPSLLKQIVSLREVNEFHEFCAEKLFCEIAKHLNPNDPLNVHLLYARRGSLDINPVRFRGPQSFDMRKLVASNYIVRKAQGQ
jgi:7-cyano-7-deazaguanine reductase